MISAQAAAVLNVATVKIANVVPTAFADLPSDANGPRRETPLLYNENAPLKTDAELATAQKTPFSRKNALSFVVRASPTRFADAKSPDYNDFNAFGQRRFVEKIRLFPTLRQLVRALSPRSRGEIRARPCFLGRPPYNIRNISATSQFPPGLVLSFSGVDRFDANRPLFLPFPL